MDVRIAGDAFGRGQCLGQLGSVAYERFLDARTAKHPAEELGRYLVESARLYEQALNMTPATAITERGVIHQLGNVYDDAGEVNNALYHYRQSIRYADEAGNISSAGLRRHNVAIALHSAGRLDDARAYAVAALANFQTFGDRAADRIERSLRLIARIDQAIAEKSSRV